MCPRLKLDRAKDAEGVTFTAFLAEDHEVCEDGGCWTMDRGTWVGSIDGSYQRRAGKKQIEVTRSEVEPSIQRCGIGTQLYERMAIEARAQKKVLVSDSHRSVDSESFWQKQLKKGRAQCISAPGERGHLYDPDASQRVTVDKWKCRRFALLPSARSLRGGRKR